MADYTTADIAAALKLGRELASARRKLTRDESTLLDIARRTSHTDAAARYACDLVARIRNPEQHVPAPLGKGVTFDGEIVSVTAKEDRYNGEIKLKLTVKVTTPGGSWLAWGTFPAALYVRDNSGSALQAYQHTDEQLRALRGKAVRVKATLELGKSADSEPHFVFMKRPTAQYIVATPPAAPVAPVAPAPDDVSDAGDTVRMVTTSPYGPGEWTDACDLTADL